jgi:phage-related minor tail protein
LRKELTKSQNLHEQIKQESAQEIDTERRNSIQEKKRHEEALILMESKLTQDTSAKIQLITDQHELSSQNLKNVHKNEIEQVNRLWKKKEEDFEQSIAGFKRNESKHQGDVTALKNTLTDLHSSLTVLSKPALKITTANRSSKKHSGRCTHKQ